MRRRQLLGFVGAGVAGSVAGCSLSDISEATERSHPFSGTTTVRVDDVSNAGQDTAAIAREGMQYWERRSEEVLGFSVSFEIAEEEPDVILAFADEPAGCEEVDAHPDEVLGCAPLVEANHTIDPPLTARIVVGQRPRGMIEITAKHELGHLLGRGHDDDPVEIMSNDPADRIPRYEARSAVQEGIRAVQRHSNDAMERYNDGVTAYNEAVEMNDSEQFSAAEDSFTAAVEAFENASDELASARQRAEDLTAVSDTAKLDRLGEQFETLEERVTLGISFTSTMQESAAAAADGNRREAQNLADDAKATIDEYEAVDVPGMREVAVALGLVQEFDRD